MNSHLTDEFFDYYRVLPEQVREHARDSYALFEQNPQHPSLRFRQVHPSLAIFSARVGMDYRVVGQREGDDIFCFWIGSHSDYDQLLRRL